MWFGRAFEVFLSKMKIMIVRLAYYCCWFGLLPDYTVVLMFFWMVAKTLMIITMWYLNFCLSFALFCSFDLLYLTDSYFIIGLRMKLPLISSSLCFINSVLKFHIIDFYLCLNSMLAKIYIRKDEITYHGFCLSAKQVIY
jgi:hypothetical protein